MSILQYIYTALCWIYCHVNTCALMLLATIFQRPITGHSWLQQFLLLLFFKSCKSFILLFKLSPSLILEWYTVSSRSLQHYKGHLTMHTTLLQSSKFWWTERIPSKFLTSKLGQMAKLRVYISLCTSTLNLFHTSRVHISFLVTHANWKTFS